MGIPLRVFLLVLACITTSSFGCIEQEREALLRVKQSLIDDYGLLSSWGSQDECCEWKGVGCSNSTGHVTTVKLAGGWSSDDIYVHTLRGKLNSALLDLHHLTTLDLVWNDFEGNPIPEFIGSIKTLQHLKLSQSNFGGSIPVHLGNLTNLRTLDLFYNLQLHSDNLHWLSRLSLLSVLDLSYTEVSDANWVQHVLMLPSLERLYLRKSMLPDVTKSLFMFNSTSSTKSLSVLDLAYNEFTSSTVDWLFNVSLSFVTFDFLETLDLSSNDLGGELEELLGKLPCRQLVLLGLRNCMLTGPVPTYVGQLSKLELLDLSHNSLEGTVSEAHFISLHNLYSLDLSFNSLALDLSPDWTPPFSLQDIRLASCKMGPSFPTWLQTQTNVTWFDLSSNFISDEVPKWFWNLPHRMSTLNLSHNQMSGTIPDLSSVYMPVIDLSFNNFSCPMPQLPSGIAIVRLSQNKFSGSISSICKLSLNDFSIAFGLVWFDLSNNQLEGVLPNCWGNMTGLKVLNLNFNKFSGEIPRSFGDLQYLQTLHLRGNHLSGELPSTLKNCQNLQLMDIGDNNISGIIPSWIGQNYTYMTHLSLRRNKFHGGIPPEICQLDQLQMLDLSGNNLSGKISNCFNNFTSLLDKNTTSTNSVLISTTGGAYIDYALVQWKGQDSEYKNTLGLLKLIDLSSNKLVGSIPETFSSLRGLICLNLSRNNLTGSIDPNIGEMKMLDCLDLSRNCLTGEIPIGLAQLHYLAVLNLAYNNLSGKIPSSTQLHSFNESVFAGNYDLCGKPLKLCREDDLKPPTTIEGENIEEKDENFWSLSFNQEFGKAMTIGFIVGFFGVVGLLLMKG